VGGASRRARGRPRRRHRRRGRRRPSRHGRGAGGARLPDWRANVVARRFTTDVEAEVYARHNVRAVRGEYAPDTRWRLLVRLLYEGLYVRPALGFARVDDPRGYVWTSTWAFDDLVRPGLVDGARWDALAAALEACCTVWTPDPVRLRA
jgi:hypothetical protein